MTPLKGYQFVTYAAKCIDNTILMHLRSTKKYYNDCSLNETIATDKDGNEKTYEDIIEDCNSNFVNDYENNLICREIREIVNNLEGRDKLIIMLYFGFIDDKQYNQKEIGAKFGLSRANVSKIISKNLKIIEKELKELDLIETHKKVLKKENRLT